MLLNLTLIIAFLVLAALLHVTLLMVDPLDHSHHHHHYHSR
jgi:hypothetical protein